LDIDEVNASICFFIHGLISHAKAIIGETLMAKILDLARNEIGKLPIVSIKVFIKWNFEDALAT